MAGPGYNLTKVINMEFLKNSVAKNVSPKNGKQKTDVPVFRMMTTSGWGKLEECYIVL